MESGAKRRESHGDGLTTMANRTHQFRELADVLQKEAGIVTALRQALIQQRAALAANDAETMNATADEIGRILLLLEQVRSSRDAVLESITGEGPVALEQLETVLGVSLPLPLEQARAELRRAGKEVAQEVAINRTVLRRAVETGEAFLQALFSSSVDPSPVYRSPDQGTRRNDGSSVILNRVV